LALATVTLDEVCGFGLFPTKLEARVASQVASLRAEDVAKEARMALKQEPEFVVIPALLKALRSSDARLRRNAASLLVEITGQDLGFDALASPSERAKSLALWQQWWRNNRQRY